MEKHSSLWAYLTAAGTAVFGGITLQEFAVWIGIITTLGTFILNWYYKAQTAKREAHLLVFRNHDKCDE